MADRIPRRLESKFPGTCRGCQKRYGAGDEVFWLKGTGCWHPECTPDEVVEAARMAEVQRGERGEAERVAKFKADRDSALRYVVAFGDKMKKLESKFPGQCSICGGKIVAGEPIRWGKIPGAMHGACWYAALGLPDSDRGGETTEIAAEARDIRRKAGMAVEKTTQEAAEELASVVSMLKARRKGES